VLERIKETGDIFFAYADEPWVLSGAAVHISFVGQDDGSENEHTLNGQAVATINANLTSGLDLTRARRLADNSGIAFQGPVKVGPFDISDALARQMLFSPNPDGRSNRDVVRPWVNGFDIAGRPRHMWIVDFGVGRSEREAALYEAPFEYVRKYVRAERTKNRSATRREAWWRLGATADDMRRALEPLPRFIATVRHSKHRLFAWLAGGTMPDSALIAFARDDDYTFGVLHSRVHELWALAQGTQLETRPRYTPTTCFETFPFPEPTNEQRERITEAARELDRLREGWLNPPGLPDAELRARTLTNLYNARPMWLAQAHERLDDAVFDAYCWPHGLPDNDVLARLLELNLARAQA
jgi:hypothetical protein